MERWQGFLGVDIGMELVLSAIGDEDVRYYVGEGGGGVVMRESKRYEVLRGAGSCVLAWICRRWGLRFLCGYQIIKWLKECRSAKAERRRHGLRVLLSNRVLLA